MIQGIQFPALQIERKGITVYAIHIAIIGVPISNIIDGGNVEFKENKRTVIIFVIYYWDSSCLSSLSQNPRIFLIKVLHTADYVQQFQGTGKLDFQAGG